MKWYEPDLPLLKAFLIRESKDYRWNDPVKGPKKFVSETLEKIKKEMEKYPKGADLAVIHSLTNLGQTQRSLSLSVEPFNWQEKNIHFYLGTTPRDGVGSSRESQGIVDVVETCCKGE